MHSQARIAQPRLEGIYPRERLFAQLDEGRKRSVVWVAGAAGSGKTTLAASYILERGLRAAWLQLDESDADPATFFHYLGLALKKALPRAHPLPAFTPEYLADPTAFARGFFAGLAQRLKRNALIVLDNYQVLPEDSLVHGLLAVAQEELGGDLSLLVLSRSLPPQVFARVRASGELALIEQDALALTEAESKALVARMCPDETCDALADKLYMQTEGWVAGLVLMLQQLDTQNPEQLRSASVTTIFDYFASELFEDVGDDLRGFLFKTALLPSFTVNMANALSGSQDADRLLDSLVRRNLFTTKRGSGALIHFQYHDLFRDFLLVHGQREIEASIYAGLQNQAAELLIGDGQYEAASGLLAAVENKIGLADLIESQAPELAKFGRLPTLEHWLNQLPVSMFETRAWLQYWRGICRLPFDPIVARSYLAQALDCFEAQADAQGVFLAWAATVDTFPQAMDELYGLDPLLDRLDSLIKRFGPLDHMVELQLAPRVLAALLVRRPSDPSFEDWRKLAFDAFDDPYIDLGLRLVAGFYLMVSHVWAGDPTHARQIVEMLKNMAREADASPIARVTALMVEGWLAALSAQREESFDAMEAGLELAKESGVHLWDSMLMLIGATVAKIRGDKETAARILDELSTQLSQLRPLDRLYFYHQRAWLAMLQDDPVRAQADQRVALEFAVRVGSKYSLADANYGMMWVMHALKDKLERDRYFAEVERLEGELNSVYLEFMLCFARAAFALDEKNPSEIRMRVADLMRLGREYWLTGMTWWQPRIASRLCSVALGEGIEVDYALHLIRLHGLVPEDETQMSTTWPYPVRIKTLGMFSVMVDDQPLQSEGRGQRKPLELLAAVIALGAVNVGEEQVMDALWPEADITQARQNLKAALHRLRRMIGMRSVSVQAGKISLDSRYVWVDVQSFMRLIEEIEACMSDGSDVPGHLLREWMSLYQGEFLAGEPGIWALQLRENVRAKALRLLEQVGDMLLRQGDGSEARKYFERGIEIDPYAEVFYRGLMQSHHQLGRVVEVRKVYERCEQLLKEAFGVGCSPETEALYRSAGMIDEGRQS